MQKVIAQVALHQVVRKVVHHRVVAVMRRHAGHFPAEVMIAFCAELVVKAADHLVLHVIF